MFSVWRKLTGKQDEKPIFPSGVLPIGETMQKKYAKGVQYNMKIIIKGDRNTGKSTLFHRLNGKAFREEYIPTHEIQVTNVNWNYQGAADIVKVEVWDIVDKSERKRCPSDSLKIANDDVEVNDLQAGDNVALDAEFLNVFKGTHGVILTMDITKAWTWQYVQRELEKIPHRIPVLIMGNFCDMGERRVVQTDEIVAYIEHLNRPTGSAEVYYTESSMKDGFGLHFAYKYLNMPFLILQRETLLKQMESNTLEIEETRETLSIHSIDENDSYSNFREMLVKKNTPCDDNKSDETDGITPEPVVDNPIENTPAVDTPISNLQPLPPLAKVEMSGKSLPVATVSPTVHVQNESIFKTYTKKLFGNSAEKSVDNDATKEEEVTDSGEVEDFDAGQLQSDFLGGTNNKPSKHTLTNKATTLDSDDDGENGNPMVANYADDFSDEEIKTFEQQFSNEAEFEDLSDDERQDLEQPNISIIEKIKAERTSKRNSVVLDKFEDYNDLDSDTEIVNSDICNEQSDVESNGYSIKTIESTPSILDFVPHSVSIDTDTLTTQSDVINDIGADIVDNVSSSIGKMDINTSHVSNTETIVSGDEEDEDNTETVYIITGDIDVGDADTWLVDEGSDPEAVPSPPTLPKHSGKGKAHSNSNTEPVLNFEIDELEMFMKDQLEKGPSTVEDNIQTVEPTKKKKKKKKVNPEERVATSTEKKKKKKVTNTDEGQEKPETATRKGTMTTTKTKKSKTASSDNTPATETEKEKKGKKVRKKETSEVSELDSFYEGL